MKIYENVPVRMIRPNLANIPDYALPSSYRIRPYQAGDEAAWTRIHLQADQYNTFPPTRFEQEFGRDLKRLAERQFYLCDASGTPIGTATAWDKIYNGQLYGRVHWVAIIPAMQGQGLAKPLMTTVCRRLGDLQHVRAYLSTSTARLPAICLYLKFGFRPEIKSKQDVQSWRQVRDRLGHSGLSKLDLDLGPGEV